MVEALAVVAAIWAAIQVVLWSRCMRCLLATTRFTTPSAKRRRPVTRLVLAASSGRGLACLFLAIGLAQLHPLTLPQAIVALIVTAAA